MKDYVVSETTGKKYYPSEVVRLVNIKQVIAYLKNEAELLDVYPSFDSKTGNPILVFIFSRKDTTRLYDLWCKHELKIEE